MTDFLLQREAVATLFQSAPAPHPGLLLSKGMADWKGDANKKGEAFQAHVEKAAALSVPDIYKAAYERWRRSLLEASTAACWVGRVDGRLFIGLGGPSVIETAITLSRTYGVPSIPGSAQKGLARAYGKAARISDAALDILFGREGKTPGAFEAGHVIFHDAWWIPELAKTPLAPEVVTVHHPEYYQEGGANGKATDFDSPVPNAQVAARGGFLFALECGAPAWALFARDLLAKALCEWGIGGKTAAGYGRFVVDDRAMRTLKKDAERATAERIEREEAERAARERKIAEDEFKRLSESGKLLHTTESEFKAYLLLGEHERRQQRSVLNGHLSGLLQAASSWMNAEDRTSAADLLQRIYDQVGWFDPGLKKAKRDKQERKRRESVENLRHQE